MLGQSITRNAVLLGLFAVVTTLLIAGTYLLTRDRIAEEERRAEEKALLQIVPRERHDNAMLDDNLPVGPEAGLGLRKAKSIHLARQGGQVVAAIIPVTAPDGYSGDIDLIVGVNRDGSIAGVRALTHRETPGLGGEIEKSWFQKNFKGKRIVDQGGSFVSVGIVKPSKAAAMSAAERLNVVDGISGATLTGRFLSAGLKEVLGEYEPVSIRFRSRQMLENPGSQKSCEDAQ